MHPKRHLFALFSLTLVLFALVACETPEQVDPVAQKTAEELAWLKENKPLLDAKRNEINELEARLAGELPAAEESEAATGEAPEGEAPEGEAPVELTEEELQARLEQLRDETVARADELGQHAAEFLNTTGIVVGGELTPDQQFVIDLKIDEDILVAREYIDKGGDYNRALDIYRQSLQLNPGNERLLAAIAEAEDLRYMTEERFAQVKSQDEVRQLLGQVKHTNVRDFPEREVLGWFYKKQDGGAAGVYFKEKKKGSGIWTVYSTDYNAVEQEEVGPEEG